MVFVSVSLETSFLFIYRYMFCVVKGRPLKHHHKGFYSNISKNDIVRIVFQVVSNEFVLFFIRVLSKEVKTTKNIFPRGVRKEEIQQ